MKAKENVNTKNNTYHQNRYRRKLQLIYESFLYLLKATSYVDVFTSVANGCSDNFKWTAGKVGKGGESVYRRPHIALN